MVWGRLGQTFGLPEGWGREPHHPGLAGRRLGAEGGRQSRVGGGRLQPPSQSQLNHPGPNDSDQMTRFR